MTVRREIICKIKFIVLSLGEGGSSKLTIFWRVQLGSQIGVISYIISSRFEKNLLALIFIEFSF